MIRGRVLAVLCALGVFLVWVAPAAASPVATSDQQYQVLGRVFPDPLANCGRVGSDPCSPNAQGNVHAISFIQYQDLVNGLTYMNSKPEWQRYLEVWTLDGKLSYAADDPVNTDGKKAFPGNTMPQMEFTPRKEHLSAGVPTTNYSRSKSKLFVARVTDENVPDSAKKRMTISLSIHGIERAGVEGGTRAMEDLVTAFTTGKASRAIVPASVKAGAPTFADVLRHTIIYFTYPNPDGWRRGSISEGGLSFQRYNGNGVDPNRDWPDIGYSFRGYSGASEPETRAFQHFYGDIMASGKKFTAGDDLHGQPFADALSFTMLPHGRHDLGKDTRLRETAKTIHLASYQALKWSPVIQPNDAPPGGTTGCVDTLAAGAACAKIYGQTWGSVYDTINYTTTGTLGDWFDSKAGLNADGIDNEMSYSHIDKDTRFDPHTEQLHVDGNKALLYAHLADMLAPVTGAMEVPGPQGYVPSPRLKRAEQNIQPGPPPGTQPQPGKSYGPDKNVPTSDGNNSVPLDAVLRSAQYYNGGMRVDVTTTNVQGLQPGDRTIVMKLQCRGCDEHIAANGSTQTANDWVTVAEDWNQQQLYARAGLTASINRPQANKGAGGAVEWRVLISPQAGPVQVTTEFSAGPATSDGSYISTPGKPSKEPPPKLHSYDVANTDALADLNSFIGNAANRFSAIEPRKVIAGTQSLSGLRTLVLADSLLPGYTGLYAGEPSGSTAPTAQVNYTQPGDPTTPSQGAAGCSESPQSTRYTPEFTIGPQDNNDKMHVSVTWSTPGDYDIHAQRKEGSTWTTVQSGTNGPPSNVSDEFVDVSRPTPGTWRIAVVNCAATDFQWTAKVDFTAIPAAAAAGPSAYTVDEKNAWATKLGEWVRAGGNLVLTDGSLKGLQELTAIPATAVSRQTVYAGQVTFGRDVNKDGTLDEPDTLSDPLAANIKQPGARFNSGMRRQTYEPTPLGFAIQGDTGADAANARQYDVDITAFKNAGGRVAGTSVDSGTRSAKAVLTRVALGEVPLGQGRIRVAGGLLPQPETSFDHPLGIESHALTYTGYILLCNLLDAQCKVRPAGSGAGGFGAGGAGAHACGTRSVLESTISRRTVRTTSRRLALRGTTRVAACARNVRLRVTRVYIAVYRPVRKGCRHMKANGRLTGRRSCRRPILLLARGTTSWRVSRRVNLPRGRYSLWVLARDNYGHREHGTRRGRRAIYRLR
ncbi:MAG: hypothetical protein QOI91_897 [Solirubrobacteraceae bacterium]|nr:hypothetical protein [Solirubrobacteraceae bacterium]